MADEISGFKSPYRASVERLSANHYEAVLTRTDSVGRSVIVKRVEKRGPKARDLADRAANQMLRQHRPAVRQANPVNTKPYKAALCDRCEAEYHWSRIGSQCDCGKPLRSVELFYDRDGILREKKRSTSSTKKKPVRKPNPVYESLTPNPLEFKERGVKTPFKLMQPRVKGPK